MNIAGLLVHARPDRQAPVERALAGMPGVEVHQSGDDGRLVVTVEDTPETSSGDTMLAIHRLEGVLSAALVYHHFEPEDDPIETEEEAHAAITA